MVLYDDGQDPRIGGQRRGGGGVVVVTSNQLDADGSRLGGWVGGGGDGEGGGVNFIAENITITKV